MAAMSLNAAPAPKDIAVVLFNLGGPDSRETIRPFLFNFFMDKNIIPAPKPIRWMLARYISITRTRGAAGTSYAMLGNKSPLLDNTNAQARALEAVLNTDPKIKFRVHVCMRYWHPMADEVVQAVHHDNPDQIILLPLYPQFSTTTSWSSLEDWRRAAAKTQMDAKTSLICCYPTQPGFVAASAALIRQHYEAMGNRPRLLFSAHGLPEDIIRGGDPYQWQCEKSAAAIAAATGIENLDWQICYQSRVGPKKWIGPSTADAIEQAARDNVPVLIYPHAFVSEHVETLVELDEEYKHLAHGLGLPGYGRVPTVSVQQAFIAGLAAMVQSRLDVPGIAADCGGRICPSGFTRCCMGMDLQLEGARPCHVLSPQITLEP
jgi:ferrochelatase